MTNRNFYKFYSICIILFCLCATTFAQKIPVPKRYVEDRANIINDSIEKPLNGYLQELEQKTGAQMVVLTIDTTNNVPIEMFAIELATQWKLGQEGKDNGALVVVAKNDRAYRVEVGYGLEGTLPDSFCGTVGRSFFVPYFRKGQYGEGIFQGVVALVHKIAEDKGVKITGMPKVSKIKTSRRRRSPLSSLFFLFIILPLLFGGSMFRRRSFLPFFFWGGFGGPRGFGSGGSSSFGGGFGGFGGGMGGSFGGGGASGSW